MNKTMIASLAAAGMLVAASATFAQTGSSTPATNSNAAAKISCVGAAVNTREQSLDAAMTTYTQTLNAAYSARATALSDAYGKTTLKEVRAAVKTAWTTFRTSTRDARKTWQSARNTAWKTYRTAAVACKPSSGLGDGVNSDSEASGN